MYRSLLPALAVLAAAPVAAAATPGKPAAPIQTYAYLRGAAGEPARRVPLLADRSANVTIASVDGSPITIADLNQALAAAHGGVGDDAHSGAGRDVTPIVDRLVTLRLFVAEAREMGLGKDATVRKAVTEFEEQQLRQAEELKATRGVRPDGLEVERAYRDAIREWKLRSLLFPKREDALAFRAAVAEGKTFAAAAAEALARKQATGNDGAGWAARKEMLPQVAEVVAKIQAAPAVTDLIAVPGGFAVASVEEVRYPADPKARAAAEEASVERQRAARLERYRDALERRYARTDVKLWKALDFEAPKPGFAALAKDRRPVVRIVGGEPVTIADVAAELQRYFFHGVDEPIKEKKLNEAKAPVLRKILSRRLYLHAARQDGIPKTPGYRRAVAEYEDSLLFGAYVQRVIVPDVKVTEDEGKVYYERHRAEFTLPAFYKLEALAFANAKAADAAAKKLAAGTDLGFLRANAEGLVKPDERVLVLDGQTLSANALPPDLVRALSGARRDDVRSYATGGQFYVVRVVEVVPAKEQPYLEARSAIGKKLAAENLNKAVKDVSAKLRGGHQVAVYLERVAN